MARQYFSRICTKSLLKRYKSYMFSKAVPL
nr:MAG TPA: hypothetical protein [Caudoviricetes sp.]